MARSSATVVGVYIDSIAFAMIGGLATSTIFTLLALRSLYSLLEEVWVAVVTLWG